MAETEIDGIKKAQPKSISEKLESIQEQNASNAVQNENMHQDLIDLKKESKDNFTTVGKKIEDSSKESLIDTDVVDFANAVCSGSITGVAEVMSRPSVRLKGAKIVGEAAEKIRDIIFGNSDEVQAEADAKKTSEVEEKKTSDRKSEKKTTS